MSLHIIHKKEGMQDCDFAEWNYQIKRFYGDEVYCPMCDAFHKNNTFCQANLNEIHGGI